MNKLMLAMVLMVNLGSSYLAGSGIHDLTRNMDLMTNGAQTLTELTGWLNPSSWRFIVSMAIAATLQLAITVFWSLRARAGGLTLLVVAAFLSLSSAWLSATFVVLSGENLFLRQQSRMEAIAPARKVLSTFADQLHATSLGLQRAKTDAERLLKAEKETGGTCPGNRKSGPGPRLRMRDRHATMLTTAMTNASGLEQDALQLDIGLQQATSEELAAVFARAVTLSRTPQIEQLREALKPIRDDLTDGWKDGGKHYTCPSPDFLAVIDKAIANLDKLQPLPSDLPLERQPSTTDSGALLWASLQALITGKAPPSDLALRALTITAVIELFQISVIGMREKRLRMLGLTPDAHDTFWNSGTAQRKRPHLKPILTALDRYTWFDGKTTFFAMPVDADDAARLPLSYFGLKLYHPSLRNFELEEIDPDWVARRNLQGRTFNLYAFPRDLERWRRIAARDLSAKPTAAP